MYKKTIGKKFAVFASATALILGTAGVLPTSNVKATSTPTEGGTAYMYTNFNVHVGINATGFIIDNTYMFTKENLQPTDVSFQAPKDSALLKIKLKDSYTDNESAYGAYVSGDNTEKDKIMAGVDVVDPGSGFDGCKKGTIYFAEKDSGSGWFYSCNGGAVKNYGPLRCMTYSKKPYEAKDVSVKVKDTFEASGKGEYKVVRPSDLEVKVTVEGKTYTVPDTELAIDWSDDTIGVNDNTVMLRLGTNSDGFVYKKVTTPDYVQLDSITSNTVNKGETEAAKSIGKITGIKELEANSKKLGAKVKEYEGITEDDRDFINYDGGDLNIYLTAEEGNKNSTENQALAQKIAAENKVFGMSLNLNLFKDWVQNNQVVESFKLTDLISPITVTINLPEAHRGKKGYEIHRYHVTPTGEIQIEKITETPNANGEFLKVSEDGKTITATLCKFSEYALAYDNEPVNDTVKSPKTGETLPIMPLATLIISAAGIMFFRKREDF